jgi:pimeloyl-ACP methyl ester carboxylesterase
MRRLPVFAILAGLCIPGLAVSTACAPAAGKLDLKPCALPGLPPDARCGTYEVWENRTTRTGRKIPLRVVLLPAFFPGRLPDPLVYFAGGPGASAVEDESWIGKDFENLRWRRDILLVDLRGTGESGRLSCPELTGENHYQEYLDEYVPAGKLKLCAERLRRTVDLTRYTLEASVDDVDEVRAALGYDKLNLFGTSGGSRTALVYLRRHPERVRTVTLWGVVPTDERGPLPMARHAQRALDGWIAECEQDAGCRAAFPRLRDEVAAVFQRVEREPVEVRIADPRKEGPVEVRLTRSGVAQIVRLMLYQPETAVLLPLHLHRAAQGDWTLLARTGRQLAASIRTTSNGYYFAATCAEDLPFIDEAAVPAAVAGTFLGDLRIRKQQAACAVWPAARLGREFLDPVVSDVPALLLSGERDPVTPPANAERAARTLANSLQVVLPDGGHGLNGIQGVDCANRMMVAFVEAGTVQGLDTSCVAGMKRPRFAVQKP